MVACSRKHRSHKNINKTNLNERKVMKQGIIHTAEGKENIQPHRTNIPLCQDHLAGFFVFCLYHRQNIASS